MKKRIEIRNLVKDCGSFCVIPAIVVNKNYETTIDIAFLAWAITINMKTQSKSKQ